MTELANTPDLWRDHLPRPARDGHKYDRGHTAILGSDRFTGATRLAAEACSRIGSGLVSVLSRAQTDTYRVTLPPDIMVADIALDTLNRPSTILAGPGGCSDAQANMVRDAHSELSLVLDADAVRLWPDLVGRTTIYTPHTGEFARYFGTQEGAPEDRALAAANKSGGIIVLKGPETLIAAPDGRLARNTHATPYLAKAGTGDVLAGLIAGLLAQGMDPFDAACAGVWIHGESARQIGPGFVPQDAFARLGGLLATLLA